MNAATQPKFAIKTPRGLSPRIAWLRDYYFQGTARAWTNEATAWTTGTPWDVVYDEITYYIVPETYAFLQTFRSALRQAARPVPLPEGFWGWSLPERRAWFIREVMVNHVPQELLPGDLLAGGRFNLQASRCWTKAETAARDRLIYGRKGARAVMKAFHDHGYGNSGATSGHLIPDYARVLDIGWRGIHADLAETYDRLTERERKGARGAQLRAMMTAAGMPRDLAARYAALCTRRAAGEADPARRDELAQMAANLERVPWEPPRTFWRRCRPCGSRTCSS
jgi:formate C-acetyltransferase